MLSRIVLALCFLLLVSPSTALARSRHGDGVPYIVVLDPGHGGDDPGAADSSQTMVEKVLTLDVAKHAASDLRAMGYRVYLTRTRDQDVNVPPRDVNHDGKIDHVDELVARNVYANRRHADVFISVHFDASASPDTHGTHGYYCPDRPFRGQNQRLAALLTASISSSLARARYASPDLGVGTDVADIVPQTRADYPWFLVLGPSKKGYVVGTRMPGALIETLYLSSPRDVAALHHRAIMAALAQGYAGGIKEYFDGRARH
ncbi:MAG: N-acetylmuramoyl-L-alanine amidase family protein [Chloroflexota bacterium]